MVTQAYYPGVDNSRRLILVDRDADGVWGRRWEAAVSIPALDLSVYPTEPLVDLDGDGLFEVVHSFWDSTAQDWTTYVRDARNGLVLASTPGRIDRKSVV